MCCLCCVVSGVCSLKTQLFLYVQSAQLIVAMTVSNSALVVELLTGIPSAICDLVMVFGRIGWIAVHMYCVNGQSSSLSGVVSLIS